MIAGETKNHVTFVQSSEDEMAPRKANSSIMSAALALAAAFGIADANADETDAKKLLKAMSDYMAAQTTISFDYDTNFEVVTKDKQKLLLGSSGSITLTRPDKIRVMRHGGFANVEMIFDGKMLTLVNKETNNYSQVEAAGTVDQLTEALREKFHRPLPGADLLLSNPYEALMADVTDVKDLGSGVFGGTECDHLAFRQDQVDWQIWIAQGDSPYPCRYVVTSKEVDQAPQYSIQLSNWKAGSDVMADDFGFPNLANSAKVELTELTDIDELPESFRKGGAQ